MKRENIEEAYEEAKRFIKKVDAVDLRLVGGCHKSKDVSAMKRLSMDLTRSLSKMRQEIY